MRGFRQGIESHAVSRPMPPAKVAKLQPLRGSGQAVAAPDRVGERTLGTSGQAFNLPNLLTFSRILLVPVYVALFSTPTVNRSLAAAAVFGIAALTDLLDGYIAKQRAQITKIGCLLDPIADKFLVISGLVLLVQFQRVEAWLAITLITRELTITGIRAIAASRGLIIAAGTLGKYKVVFQMMAIIVLTLEGTFALPVLNLHLIGTVGLYAALVLSLVSAGHYIVEVWKALPRLKPSGTGLKK